MWVNFDSLNGTTPPFGAAPRFLGWLLSISRRHLIKFMSDALMSAASFWWTEWLRVFLLLSLPARSTIQMIVDLRCLLIPWLWLLDLEHTLSSSVSHSESAPTSGGSGFIVLTAAPCSEGKCAISNWQTEWDRLELALILFDAGSWLLHLLVAAAMADAVLASVWQINF